EQRGRRSRAAAAARQGDRRELGAARAPEGADRTCRPRRRGHGGATARRRGGAGAGSDGAVRRARRRHAGAGARAGAAARMRTLRTIADIRAALATPRRAGRTIGLVPTMGAFHEGHLSLMRRAREECNEVVVSLFVNPAQFNERADLDAYPRDERADAALAAHAGVDWLFAPSADEIYPPGFATTVSVGGVTEMLEGAHRGRRHFDGVTTVVTKLLNIVAPE